MAELEIEINGNIDGFKKAVADVTKVGKGLSNPFKETQGVINTLNQRASILKKNLESATDIKSIAQYNRRLQEVNNELQRIKSVGVQPLTNFGNAAQRTALQVRQLGNSTSSYNSIGIEFSRIIQDAPFGIIGVGNNITQLTQNFASLRAQSTSTGAALKTAFQSIISPTNLLVLGISAVTTAFTLYALSARGAKGPIDDLKEAQDSYNDSLKETDRLLGREVLSQFLKEVGLIEQQNIGGRLIDVPTFENAGQVIDALGGKIENLRKGELDLLAKFLKNEIAEATRGAANNAGTFAEQLANQDIELYNDLLSEVNKQLAFYKDDTNKSTKATKDLQDQINSFSTDPLVDAYFRAVEEGVRFRESLERAAYGLTGNEGRNGIENFGINLGSEAPIKEIADEYESGLTRIQDKVSELGSAFTGLGSLIGRAFNNSGLGQFVGQFLQFAAKLVAANFTIAKSSAVAGASNSALATGPGAVFTLPAFIAGAVGLIASAFSGIGGGGGGATSGVGAGATSQSFGGTGAFNNPSDLFANVTFEIEGNKLVGVIDRTNDRFAKG